jgi:CheY-like chemotaxis protein
MHKGNTAVCKILVIDNQPDVLSTLNGTLSDAGHIVTIATNEGEAFSAVVQKPFDFVLIDVRLHREDEEDESGLSLAMAFHALAPQIRVILLTRYVRAKQIVRAIRYHGAVGFVDKSEADWCRKVLETIEQVCKEEAKRPRFEKTRNATQLSLWLTADQPITIKGHGRHICSMCTAQTLRVDAERYARKTEITRQDSESSRFQIGEIGRELWSDIFAGHPEVVTAYIEARAKSWPLLLLFETPREFLRLPLEFIRSKQPQEFLVLQHPLARFVQGTTPKREAISPQVLALTEKLRVLIIASNTSPPIPAVDIEAQKLYNSLNSQECIPVDPRLIPTEHATYECVQAELRSHNYDILHYAGHGSYNPESPEESSLCFWTKENSQGTIKQMKANELEFLLGQSEARLVYLSCCYGAATGSQAALLDDDFLGLADAAAQAGVPSVLGFRWPVSNQGALKLAQAFYRSLLEQGSPEVALWSARCELAALDRNDPTWLSPILIHQE